jgi:hypothetical protein
LIIKGNIFSESAWQIGNSMLGWLYRI